MIKRICLVFFISMFFFSIACSATPTTPKSEEFSSEETPSATQTPAATQPPTAAPTQAINEVPTHYTHSVDTGSDKLSIEIDADVSYKELDEYPIYKISYLPFSDDEAKEIVHFFLGEDITVYDTSTAQTENNVIEIAFQEQNWSEDYNMQIIHARVQKDGGGESTLLFENKSSAVTEQTVSSNATLFLNPPDINIADKISYTPTEPMTQESAVAYAEAIISALNIEDMVIHKIDSDSAQAVSPNGFRLTAVRAINGIPISNGAITDAKEFSVPIDNNLVSDSLLIGINDGSVSVFDWQQKSDLEEIGTQAELLPFSEIIAIADKELTAKYSIVADTVRNNSLSIGVDQINLEYKNMPTGAGYETVPVWNFYGSSMLDTDGVITENVYGLAKDTIHLCINAADGSVIG